MSEPKKLTEMFAWVCTEPDGGEGIPTIMLDGMMFPMLGGDKARIESFRSHAQAVAANSGYPMRLVRFSEREVLEEL